MEDKNEFQISGVMSKGYGIMPKMVALDENLSIEAKAIYAFLTSFSGVGQGVFPSVETMTHYLKISENRFLKYRKELVNNGYITIQPRYTDGKRTSNLYILNMDNTLHLQNECVGNEGIGFKGIGFEGSNNNKLNNNKLNNNNSITDLKEIEDLWTLYPKKVGKADAIKKIPKLLKKYSKEELERCITRYANEVKGKDQQYTLNGSTFFNGRYEDYLDANFIEIKELIVKQPIATPQYKAFDLNGL